MIEHATFHVLSASNSSILFIYNFSLSHQREHKYFLWSCQKWQLSLPFYPLDHICQFQFINIFSELNWSFYSRFCLLLIKYKERRRLKGKTFWACLPSKPCISINPHKQYCIVYEYSLMVNLECCDCANPLIAPPPQKKMERTCKYQSKNQDLNRRADPLSF